MKVGEIDYISVNDTCVLFVVHSALPYAKKRTAVLKNMKANGVEFKKELWDMLVEKGIVATDGKVTLYFVGGIEVTV